uniref:C-type lectin domain-containing protein n=1 Tax=Salmo trutta TaxID=8032 RepID=A0A673Z2W1_SALTR
MIQPALLLLLLAAMSSPVFGTEISVLEGTSVTLVCSYLGDRKLETCWGRTCGTFQCTDPMEDQSKYKINSEVGTVNLTILNLKPADSVSYCCRVYVPGWFNDLKQFYSLRVVKACGRDLLYGVDFRGNNIEYQPLKTENASRCRQECTKKDNCPFFTFVGEKADIIDNRNKCFLMASTGKITVQPLEHATSGYSLRHCSGKVTYSTKKYNLVLEMKNWTESQVYCRQHYTNLSNIHTEQDWKEVQSTLSHFNGGVWIGLHRDKPNPDEMWRWSDGEDFMFFNWKTGYGGQNNHDCTISYSSQWMTVGCTAVYQYMCQRVQPGNGTTEKEYELMPGPKTQKDAETDCKKINGRELASICNQKEQEAFDEVTTGNTWIGLENDKLWKWSNGEPFHQWKNNMGDGNCVQLDSDRKWTLKDCSSQSAFLCYGDERPLNTTGDLTTPVTPKTTSHTSTGPPSIKTSTTTPPTLLRTTTTEQSTTSTPTTTNGQSTTSPTTTTNGKSSTATPTTTNGQSTTSPPTTTNGQSTTSPPTTTNGQSTTSPPTTTNGQSITSPPTTTNGQSTTPPTSTSSGQLTSSCPTSPDRKPTSSPSSTTSPLHPDYLHYFNESRSWINALKFCKSHHSNLVHITNQTVQTDLTQLLANVELACGGVWIGLERSIFEWSAPWLWTSGDVDKVVKYSEWHSCFPLNPMNYHCGKMVRVDNGELKWLDASCHQELTFICQGAL